MTDDEFETEYERVTREKKHIVDDLKYILDNYDTETGGTHSRLEYWSLDWHLLNDLEFNVPLIMKSRNIPMNYIRDVSGEDMDSWGSEAVTELACKRWHDDLTELLHHVWAYKFYDNFCLTDEDETNEEKKKFLDTLEIPKDHDDYDAFAKLAETEWKKIWDWVSRNGRNLWT